MTIQIQPPSVAAVEPMQNGRQQSTTEPILYPESDGKPMSENTKHYDLLTTIKGNLDILYAKDPNVFVAGDLLWYPVEGNNRLSQAPDVMVIFGRPKMDRGSYLQWKEENIAPQVVFEIRSPGNRNKEMKEKFEFYEKHGAEAYYLYDPDRKGLEGWLRQGDKLVPIEEMNGWQSPRLGIYFEWDGEKLALYDPEGQPFLTFVELSERWAEETRAREEEAKARIEAEERADSAEKRADAAEAQVVEFKKLLRQAGLLDEEPPAE